MGLHIPLWIADPRRRPVWFLLFGVGLAFRAYAVLFLRNPMDRLFSDPWRHWDNAVHFLDPGPQGAANPFAYQLYLFLVQQVTRKDPFAIGCITAALSVSYPLLWYGFARSVFRERINALRFGVALCWLPTHIAIFCSFMNEALVLPLIGAALWLTRRTMSSGTPLRFVATTTAWTVAVLTRSIVGPIGLACVLASWIRLRRRRWAALAIATAPAGIWVAAASMHAHGVLKRYTPFGDNKVVAIYFVSGTHDYTMEFKGYGTWYFSSPSLYLSPFTPFYDFRSIRQGVVAFTVDPDEGGKDVEKVFHEQLDQNWKKLPRLVYENLIFTSFGHSWPTNFGRDAMAQICLWERWIWLPLTLASLIGSVAYLTRRGLAFVPLVALGFLFTVFVLAQLSTLMEGRYRVPLEPVVLLVPFWLWERRRDPSPG